MILRGTKTEEYRSRPTRSSERVYIYAGLRPGDPRYWKKIGKEPGRLPTGVIVGTVEIVECKWKENMGCYAWKLARPRRLRSHLQPTNQPPPGIWRPHSNVAIVRCSR